MLNNLFCHVYISQPESYALSLPLTHGFRARPKQSKGVESDNPAMNALPFGTELSTPTLPIVPRHYLLPMCTQCRVFMAHNKSALKQLSISVWLQQTTWITTLCLLAYTQAMISLLLLAPRNQVDYIMPEICWLPFQVHVRCVVFNHFCAAKIDSSPQVSQQVTDCMVFLSCKLTKLTYGFHRLKHTTLHFHLI